MTAYVLLPKWILRSIQSERQRHLPRETGGFLIGARRGPHIEVTSMTEQGPGDIASHSSFERCCVSHRKRIHAAWTKSGGLESLVGDWHSHPHGTADASSIDRTAWRTMVRASRRTIIGLVDAGAALPNLYFAAESQRPFAIDLALEHEELDHLAFVIPSSTSTSRPRAWLGALGL